uniref:Ig-like domain-containing protein n=1 Tax=Ditylenchus dipsaci TaxID=166011 RepID=A0A915CT10_9BILA
MKIIISRSQKTDEGNYACTVRNAAGESRVDFQLEVLTKPVILMLEKDKNRTVIKGNELMLVCPSTGKPEPSITWYKNGELLLESNISRRLSNVHIEGYELKFTEVGAEHVGRYSCEARNKAGVAEQDVQLEVISPPRIQRDNLSSEVSGELGHRISITCPAFGHPPPQITWLKSNKPLNELSDVYLSSSKQRLHFAQLNRVKILSYKE